MGNGESLGIVTQAFQQKYVIGRLLGKGSQGRVHACVHRKTGAELAVKVIERTSRSAYNSYTREVELCKATSSRHVVQVLEEFIDDEYCYAVMEKYEGHLRKCMKWGANQSEPEERLVLSGIGNGGVPCHAPKKRCERDTFNKRAHGMGGALLLRRGSHAFFHLLLIAEAP